MRERESVLYTLLSRTKYNSEKAAENAVHTAWAVQVGGGELSYVIDVDRPHTSNIRPHEKQLFGLSWNLLRIGQRGKEA